MYAHGLKIEMLNNEKVFGSKQANALNRMVKTSLKIQRGNQKLQLKERQTMQWPKEKGLTTVYKILHRKLRIGQQEPHSNNMG